MKQELNEGRAFSPRMHGVRAEGARTIPIDCLRPMLAGARARGIVDGFEMMGYGVALLGDSGKVLHASDRACALLRSLASVTSDHLVGESDEVNGAIEGLIGALLAGAGEASAILADPALGRRVRLRLVQFPQTPDAPDPLLKGVLAISEV